ncbi:MAG: uroporphyrinogen decarboxylase, partial [Acidobacteria bacterium]|nr:uroporphyrinogen decarboxylase [Acidobacteriota bacterium]
GAKRLGVPVILYVNGAAHLLEAMADAGADVIGIDWRVSAAEAIRRVGSRAALQGNLDPCALFAPADVVERETNRVLDEFSKQAGYVFNLGSGILQKTPVASMEAVFRAVKARRSGS